MSERFQASVLRGHHTALTEFVGRLQAGVVVIPTAQELADLGNLAGALNYWAGQDAPNLPVNIQHEIAYLDLSRKTFQAEGVITAFPFRVPNGPFIGPNGALLYMASAEFQGAPIARLMTVSATPGDMNVSLRSQGKNATISGYVGAEFQPGALLYANIMLVEDCIPGQSGSGFSIIWPQ